jgi:hypothetical protein
MDINDQLQPIVANILESLRGTIESNIRDQINQEVIKKIASTEILTIIQDSVSKELAKIVNVTDIETTTKQRLDRLVEGITAQINSGLAKSANQQITAEINKRIALVDINTIVDQVAEKKLSSYVSSGSFPENSIPHTSINFEGFSLSGDRVRGGIIEQFGSVGIEDRSTFVQMTLMDHATAFEGPIYVPEMNVRGNVTIEGNMFIRGEIPTDAPVFHSLVINATAQVKKELNQDLFTSYSNLLNDKINENGLDLDKITQGGKEIVKGNRLGYHITDTNVERLGIVRDFQTQGENLLSDTLYVADGRVGVNTKEPSAAFVVWDQECEMVMVKRKNDTGYIGAQRRQVVVLGANNKENITLDVDGTAIVPNLTVNKVPMSSAPSMPNYSGSRGQILWNENPELSEAIGWVCLGGTRWAKFGTIG